MRRELDDALRVTTETLSEITNLLAVATAPALDSATIRRIEVLTLQPSVVLVVIITSSGGVSKFVGAFDEPVDPGLVAWAGEYLNERVGGLAARRADAARPARRPGAAARASARSSSASRPPSPSSPAAARTSSTSTAPSRLLGAQRFIGAAERRRADGAARAARRAARGAAPRARRSPACTCGSAPRTTFPGCTRSSVVAAGYGLAQRSLGTVSVIGPVRMDYAAAIAIVRAVARELSRFVQERLLMARPATPRDPYEVLGVARAADEAQIKKAFRTLARELHPDVNTDDPQAEEKFKEAAEAYEILSDPERRATYDRYGHEGLRSGGYQPNFDQFGSLADLFEAFFGGGGRRHLRRRRHARARRRRRRRRRARARPRAGRHGRRRSRSPTRRSPAASTATATAPSPARRSRPASAAAARASCRR